MLIQTKLYIIKLYININMKIYELNGKLYQTVQSIEIDGKTVYNPTDKQLKSVGYSVLNITNKKRYKNTDDKIDCRCQKHSDHLFVKYLIFKELGDMEQAEYFKNKWIHKRTFIKCACKGIKQNNTNTVENEQTTENVTNEDNITSTINSDNNAE